MPIHFDMPDIQVNFANALLEIRSQCLQDALASTAFFVSIRRVDEELYQFADYKSLQILAGHGMRGELLFAVPCVLMDNPRLLAYYRLLLGYSQKSFYTAATGAGLFKAMEDSGTLSKKQRDSLPFLCSALNESSQYLLEHLDSRMICAAFLDQLTLLTLGPQLRGGVNVQKGSSAISDVFHVIFQIVQSSAFRLNPRQIDLRNNSGRNVVIQFSSDPDIVIREELEPGHFKNQVAIEVKGGQDYSNIHNRIGEAEKSHQKARKSGYVECWTVVNVDRIDMTMAHRESPTTNNFFHLSQLLSETSEEYRDFSMQIRSACGI